MRVWETRKKKTYKPQNREFKVPHRWQQQKRSLKSRVSSPYFNLHRDYFSLLPTSIVKRRRIVLEMNSWESHPSSEKERKFRRSLFTSLYQKKCRTDMQSCCFAGLWLLLFWLSPCRHRPGILNWFPINIRSQKTDVSACLLAVLHSFNLWALVVIKAHVPNE